MKSNYLILIISIIVIILLLIFAIIYNNVLTVNIELFTTSSNEFKYPININTNYITTVPLSKASTFYDKKFVATVEQYEESAINDYILAVYSSFTVTGNNILAILNATGNSIILTPSTKTGNDYIFFDLPEESNDYSLTKITITYNNNDYNNINLFKIATVNFLNAKPFDTAQEISATPSTTNGMTITYTLPNNTKLYSNLIFTTQSKLSSSITIKLFEFYFTTDTGSYDTTNTISMLSDNENEYIDLDMPDIVTENAVTGNNDADKILAYKYAKILKLKIPWAIYDASVVDIYNINRLKDTIGRSVRDAIISGNSHSYMKDPNNINYLNGTTNTKIQFPSGSLMNKHFTCCVISKYTSSTGNNNNILTDMGSKLMIGHYNGIEGVVKIAKSPQQQWPTSATANATPNWTVTCIKSKGNDAESLKTKSIIINNINVNYGTDLVNQIVFDNPVVNFKNTDIINELPISMKVQYYSDLITDLNSKSPYDYMQRLIINSDFGQRSDFGLAYLIIWDTILTDNELVIVSKVLNNYVNNLNSVIPTISFSVPLYDGSTMERAGVSALAIKQMTNTNVNGLYWIKPYGAVTATQVYCIMDTNCNGGGWMLAIKAAPNSTTFSYNSTHWTTNSVLIPANDKFDEINGNYMDTTLDAKYDIYNTYQVTDCLAIFDSRELVMNGITNSDNTNTDPNYPRYGWRWFETGFNNNTPITLLDFFKQDIKNFKYTNNYKGDPSSYVGMQIKVGMNGKGTYLPYNDFNSRYINSGKAPYNSPVWSTQFEYMSYGFNPYIHPDNITTHLVRWGGVFNENPTGFWYYSQKDSRYKYLHAYLPNSIDVSGGIGLYNTSAGDRITCCANKWGINKSLSFKWFIR